MVEWSSLLNSKITVGAVTITAASVAAAVVIVSKWKQKKFELVGKVTALNCYPVKSCAGITNDVAFCTVSGIKMFNTLDRHFVIVRPSGDFVTQRQIPRMAGIKTSSDGQDLILKADNMPEIQVPLYPTLDREKVVPCRVWASQMEAQDCGQEVASWISEYVKEELRLLVFVQGLPVRYSPAENANNKDTIFFPDRGPYLVATEESLADVVSHVGTAPDGAVTMKNFRPNIVIQGTKGAWDEDNWSYLKIGKKLQMRILTPCGRNYDEVANPRHNLLYSPITKCQEGNIGPILFASGTITNLVVNPSRCLLTTVDPGRYEKRKDEEPLKTLKSFRNFPEIAPAPLFGILAGVDVESTIQIGDPVYVVRK